MVGNYGGYAAVLGPYWRQTTRICRQAMRGDAHRVRQCFSCTLCGVNGVDPLTTPFHHPVVGKLRFCGAVTCPGRPYSGPVYGDPGIAVGPALELLQPEVTNITYHFRLIWPS